MSGTIYGSVLAAVVYAVALGAWQAPSQPGPFEIPADAIALEGVPTVRVDVTQSGTTRQVLTPAEAAAARLAVKVVDGRFYWASRENKQLRFVPAGEFVYLASEPGSYIKLTRVNDRISYVEHVDHAFASVTWWGELRIVLGK